MEQHKPLTKAEWIKHFPKKYKKAAKLGIRLEIYKGMGWPEPNNAKANKELLKTLDKRPSSESKDIEEKRLGKALSNYTSPSSESYDNAFDKEIRELKPHWFKTKKS